MRKSFPGAALIAFLTCAACAGAGLAAEAADVAGAQHSGSWGFDLEGRDLTTAPGADFFQYANGTYMAHMVIPPDRSRFGSFVSLQILSESRVQGLLEKAAADPAATGDERKAGDFYAAFMNETRIEALDAKPLAADLAAIRAADTREAIAALMGRANKGFLGAIFDVGISPDAKSPQRYAVDLAQGGLGLPDRDYYLEASFAPQKAKYEAYVGQLLKLVDWPDADAQAKAVVAMETQIARVSWSRAERRDAVKTYNPMSPDALAKFAPGYPWPTYLAAADLGSVDRLIVRENTATSEIAKIFAATPIATLQAWEAFTLVDNASPFLSKRFADANFEFREKALSGQPQQKPRWKRAEAAVDGGIGEAVGELYVAKYFPPQSKAKMEALVADLHAALAARIERVAWMSAAPKPGPKKSLRK